MIRIIPAIDIINGQCVRLAEGDFSRQKTYDASPIEVAKRYEANGITHLHVVDLDGARARKPVNMAVLESIAVNTKLKIDFGGGIQSQEAIERAFNAGASQITAGSIAVREPATVKNWLQKYGPERIIVGADFKNNTISINAWAEQSSLTLADFISGYQAEGAKNFICTDVSKDGLLQGPATTTYQELVQQFPAANIIASGGVTTVQDIEDLQAAEVSGVIIGKALYEGTILLQDLKPYLC
ncbi:MAG: 1-(5-phosphoribosyl)-5-[(5-phosphoribosylamino)methylideneamino]imidazole-4-carboxamide isomerase [Cytophagales bacterium CG18_big_fil_WC_8_21_14_2_50_42_9]|nr:MAG: 1-(5-phosphoribosyl)-5-[(5-phosphoribosylamino)methylideneamino]imidazole-4-carboxamide isomerase [Cytophagales bacterium CG18_big_fil_WC_8_21_14_2_50_42_9]